MFSEHLLRLFVDVQDALAESQLVHNWCDVKVFSRRGSFILFFQLEAQRPVFLLQTEDLHGHFSLFVLFLL